MSQSALTFPLLLLCFFLSGLAALIYEMAWSREFAFVFGTSEIAVAMVLAAYMGGLAAGSALAARWIDRVRRPVLVYGLLELGIAIAALCVPLAIGASRALYVALFRGTGELGGSSGGLATSLFYVGASFLILMIPTSMMGATLPLLARHAVGDDRQIGARVGLLYGINTIGAVCGASLTAFVLLPEIGLRSTIWVAAGLNAVIFLLAVAVSRTAGVAGVASPSEAGSGAVSVGRRAIHWILLASAISGAVSFSYEVIWVRLLSHLLGSSVQAFGTMLSSFLAGIALGSALASRLASSPKRAVLGYAGAQLGAGLLSWLAYQQADRIREFALVAGDAAVAAGWTPVFASGLSLFPAAVCIGATFPFAVRILARDAADAAQATARVYAWNTLGSIVGSIGAAFWLLPGLGFSGAVMACVTANLLLCAAAGLLAVPRRVALSGVSVLLIAGLFLAPPPAPWRLLTTTSLGSLDDDAAATVRSLGIGRSATVLLRDLRTFWELRTNGLPEAGMTRPGNWHNGSPITRWLTILPVLARPELERMLVIGFGGGTAIEVVPSTVERIDVIELEPEVIEANALIREERWRDPLSDPRVVVHLNDARNALLLADPETTLFDAIVSQPSHPWSGGAAHLYTQEFFELAASRLSQDGVFLQWIGKGFLDESLTRELLAALTGAFEHVEIYQPPPGAALLFLCSNAPLDVAASARRALEADPEAFASLGLHETGEVLSSILIDEAGVAELAAGAAPNRDAHNRLQARSERLGWAAIAVGAPFLDEQDALLGSIVDRDDGLFVLRQLVPFQIPRLVRLVERMPAGPDKEFGEALAELGLGKMKSARQKLERVLEEAPDHREARAALLVLRAPEIAQGTDPTTIVAGRLEPAEETLVAAWRVRAAAQGIAPAGPPSEALMEWRVLDGDLASIPRIHPLWQEANRIRIALRLQEETDASLAEALSLAEAGFGPHPAPADLILRARILARLGDHAGALDMLLHAGRRFEWEDPRTQAYYHEASKIIRTTPASPELDYAKAAANHSIQKKNRSRPGVVR